MARSQLRSAQKQHKRKSVTVATSTILFDEVTFLQEASPTANAGNNVIFSLTVNASLRRHTLMRANVAALAGRQAVSSAVKVSSGAAPAADRHLHFHPIQEANADWTELGATWDTKDGSTFWIGDVGANGGTDAGCSVAGQDYDSVEAAAITFLAGAPTDTKYTAMLPPSVVQGWIDGVNGGLLVRTSDGNQTPGRSDDYGVAENRPYLVVRHKKAPPVAPLGPPLAFPDAVGYGRFSRGGRGGQVLFVTTLADAVPAPAGSLRAAINASGPRIAVFRVAGTIELVDQLTITNPYITIAGQTAPGGGICLKNGITNVASPISYRTHDIIISNITSRPGIGGTSLADGEPHGDSTHGMGNVPNGVDAYNIYIRNCSTSWSCDMALTAWNCHDYTADGCLMSEPFRFSTHSYTVADPTVGHSKAFHAANTPSRNITLYQCVMAHSDDRMPAMRVASGYTDQVNCIAYNWGPLPPGGNGYSWVSLYADAYGNIAGNIVNNYYKPGLDSGNRNRIYYNHPGGGGNQFTCYLSGNTDTSLGAINSVFHASPASSTLTMAGSPVGDAAYGTPLTAAQAYAELVTNRRVGNWYRLDANGDRVAREDSVQTRIIDDIINGTGRIISSNDPLVVWPTLAAGTPYTDSNNNGIPDAYEAAHPGIDEDTLMENFLWG